MDNDKEQETAGKEPEKKVVSDNDFKRKDFLSDLRKASRPLKAKRPEENGSPEKPA